MELGKHLGKGMWGLADKALPVAYGVGFVVLVIRVLPQEEFGNFVLIQEIFLIITGLANGFALQPLLKFAAEDRADSAGVISAGLLMSAGFTLVAALLVLILRVPASALLNSPRLAPLMLYLPALLAASFIRNFALNLLQTKFLIKQIFWVDAVHFLGAPILVWVVSRMREFDTALDLIIITIISLSASSIAGFWLTRSMILPRRRPEGADIKKLWDYGKYSLGGIASLLFYTKSDSFFLSSFGGPVQVAVYNSVKVFIRVYDMVTQVVQMFVMPAASNLSSKGELSSLKVLVEKAILFSTIGMMPVLFLFLFFSSPLVHLVYTGRYTEAIPLLQVFALLSLVVPVIAIASNTLMGLGEAKVGFVLSMQMLAASTLAYLVLIPLFGALGATVGYVLASVVFAWLNVFQMNRFVPVTIREVLGRTRDIEGFLRSRLRR